MRDNVGKDQRGAAEIAAPRPAPQTLRQTQGRLSVRTSGCGMVDISRHVRRWLDRAGAATGLLTVFVRHTSASLTIQENADPDVQADLMAALDRLAPQSGLYEHCAEGPDDMPAHIKAMVTATSPSIPVSEGRPVLGTWQAIYLMEHRARPHDREIVLHFVGTISGE